MKPKSLLCALLMIAGPVMAQSTLPPVEVRGTQVYPNDEAALSFACDNPQALSPTDIESLLQIKDRSQTHQLSNKLMGAVMEACNAGVPHIVVERGKQGQSLTWRPAYEYEVGIALY